MGKQEMRKQLAALSFSEKVKILEKLRDRSLAFAEARRKRKESMGTLEGTSNGAGGLGHDANSHRSLIEFDAKACEQCPANKVRGLNKVLGKVEGKTIFLWAQSPGEKENEKHKELVGPAGTFLWKELKRVDIDRDDCDVQNVVRCWPMDEQEDTGPRPRKPNRPNKQELECCSAYNAQALEKSKARLHLVFGQIAAKQILGRDYNNHRRILDFSEVLKAPVVCLDHPSSFLYKGYSADIDKPPNEALKRFRADLDEAAKKLSALAKQVRME